MVNVCQKGKRVERECAHLLAELTGEIARRTEQHNGNPEGEEGGSDVTSKALPTWHIESKGTTEAFLIQSKLKSWITQIKNDCPINKLPVVFWKANGKEFLTIMRHDDFKKASSGYDHAIESESNCEETFYPHELFKSHDIANTMGIIIYGLPAMIPIFGILHLVAESEIVIVFKPKDWYQIASSYQLSSAKIMPKFEVVK